jgi:nicotinic acid phosphoribosyltransferase
MTTPECPFLLDTDSYKLSHAQMYPSAKRMTAYFTFRGPLTASDHRVVFYGMRHIYETLLTRRVTWADIEAADAYLAKHAAGGVPFDYPRDLWVRVIEERDGYIPIRVLALREGETVYPQVPCFITEADAPFERLVTWFETKMMRVWNPSTTATKSAQVYTYLRGRYEQSVDPAEHWRLAYTLHDFGSRGVSSAESGMWSGAGHLVVFDGTDNLNAAWKATHWNEGRHVGQSVIASEHSVMTSWPDEDHALERLIEITPEGGILSCVADSYDYDHFLWEIVPRFVEKIRAKNLHFVVRPDSGDPVRCVTDGLRALEKAFGATTNALGFKVIDGAGVIQGDGIDARKLMAIGDAVHEAGYSAQCVVYGMGGGLLQKQNRDTLKCANKLCEVVDLDGTSRPIMKLPKTDGGKFSMPGNMQVTRVDGIPTIYPMTEGFDAERPETDMLEEMWNCGPTGYTFESFDQVRARHRSSWDALPPLAKVISPVMQAKIDAVIAARRG